MPFLEIAKITPKIVIPGFTGRVVKSNNMTLVYWEIDEGATLPEHFHPQEQIVSILEGRLELTLSGETKELEPGMVAVISPNQPHSVKAVTKCRALDVFHPHREI